MIQDKDAKAISRTVYLLGLLKEDGDSIFKIISIVQEHIDFFDIKLGDSCLRSAADKLEKLVK